MNLNELEAGIQYWKKHTRWNRDFHQKLYQHLERKRKAGVASFFDRDLVRLLRQWQATRGVTDALVQERGAEFWPGIVMLYDSLGAIPGTAPLDFSVVTWERVAPLFYGVAKIKGVASTVFASKLCHFLLPPLFLPCDQKVLGIRRYTYEQYWRQCQKQWQDCTEKDILIARMKEELPEPDDTDYPWATKLSELCRIGQEHG